MKDILHNEDDKIFNSSGIIIFENIDGIYRLVLFKNKKNDKFCNLGGSIEVDDLKSKDVLLKCALREGFEESCLLLDIEEEHVIDKNEDNKFYIDIESTIGGIYHRCFFICIKKNLINFDNYYNNLKSITKTPLYSLKIFNETYEISYFDLNNLNKDVIDYKTLELIELSKKEDVFSKASYYELDFNKKKIILRPDINIKTLISKDIYSLF